MQYRLSKFLGIYPSYIESSGVNRLSYAAGAVSPLDNGDSMQSLEVRDVFLAWFSDWMAERARCLSVDGQHFTTFPQPCRFFASKMISCLSMVCTDKHLLLDGFRVLSQSARAVNYHEARQGKP